MRLAGEEPRMRGLRQFDHFDQQVVHRLRADDQAGVFELRAIAVVELVAMAMAFADDVLAVQLVRERAGLDALVLQAQAHRAAEVAFLAAAFDIAGGRAPFGDQADHRMFAALVVLGGVGVGQVQHVARVIDHRRLHAVADAEVRDAVFARVTRGQHLALEAAIAEAARHEDAVDAFQRLAAVLLDVVRIPSTSGARACAGAGRRA